MTNNRERTIGLPSKEKYCVSTGLLFYFSFSRSEFLVQLFLQFLFSFFYPSTASPFPLNIQQAYLLSASHEFSGTTRRRFFNDRNYYYSPVVEPYVYIGRHHRRYRGSRQLQARYTLLHHRHCVHLKVRVVSCQSTTTTCTHIQISLIKDKKHPFCKGNQKKKKRRKTQDKTLGGELFVVNIYPQTNPATNGHVRGSRVHK